MFILPAKAFPLRSIQLDTKTAIFRTQTQVLPHSLPRLQKKSQCYHLPLQLAWGEPLFSDTHRCQPGVTQLQKSEQPPIIVQYKNQLEKQGNGLPICGTGYLHFYFTCYCKTFLYWCFATECWKTQCPETDTHAHTLSELARMHRIAPGDRQW